MVIGVLETDCLAQDLRERFGTYPQMFAQWLAPHCPALAFRTYQAIEGELPQQWSECDAYVITGSKHGAYDDLPWIHALMAWIRRADAARIPLAGICFGHQVIAHALGGRTEKSRNGWGVGVHEYQVACPRLLQRLGRERLAFLVSHQDQVVQLPPHAARTLRSDFCENAGFRIGSHILTFQGHPEFLREYIQHLMASRRDRLGESCFARALDSLDRATDASTVARWLLDALYQPSQAAG